MKANIDYKLIKPDILLADFVESFWFLKYQSENQTEKVVVPDGNIDLFFSKSSTQPFKVELKGLETKPNCNRFETDFILCAISFKPLAAEYIFRQPIADLLDGRTNLPDDFWVSILLI